MNGWTMQTSPLMRSSGRRFRHSQGSIAGPWIPQFEELVRYTDREIPRGEGLLLIPGEDPFYYTTGRRPRFPVLMLDSTLNPYGSEELLNLARAQKIRWLIVKRKLQVRTEIEDEARIIALLQQDFEPVKRLDNYDIYQRK